MPSFSDRRWFCLLAWFAACTQPAPQTQADRAQSEPVVVGAARLCRVRPPPSIEDRLAEEPLDHALRRQMRWAKAKNDDAPWLFGGERLRMADLKANLRRFNEHWRRYRANGDQPRFGDALRRDFAFFELRGSELGPPLITSYFTPELEARLSCEAGFEVPLYAPPPRPEAEKKLPSRAEIDGGGALRHQDLEVAQLSDPFEVFLLHIQGGGRLVLDDGRVVMASFAGKNGHTYRSLGREMVARQLLVRGHTRIPDIRGYLDEHPDQLQALLNHNPSYVFYEIASIAQDRQHPPGSLGFSVSPGRSIATDRRYFGGGAIALIQGSAASQRAGLHPGFVLDQDTGSAIRGAHVDFYSGAGTEARTLAESLADRQGKLTFLLLRESAEALNIQDCPVPGN